MSIQSLLQILRTRFWVILLLPLLSVGAAYMLVRDEPDLYAANAKLLIDYRTPLEGELAGELLPVGLQESYVATQLQIIKSDRVARAALAKLDLSDNPVWRDAFAAEGLPADEFTAWAARTLSENLTVTIGKDSRVVSLWYSDSDPRFAAEVANAFAGAYREINLELGHAPAVESAKAVEPLLAKLRLELEEADRKLSAYQQQTGIIATDENLDLETAHLKELGEQRLIAEAKEREATGRLASLERLGKGGKTSEVPAEFQQNELIQRMRFEIQKTESEIAERSVTLGRRHPELQRLTADLQSLRDSLAAEQKRIVSSLRRDLMEARALAEGARRSEAAQRDKVLKFKNTRDGLQPLLREKENARDTYDRSLRMYSEYATHANLNQSNVSLLDPATPPLLPSTPSALISLVAALVGGLLLAMVLVVAWELMDRRVRARDDLFTMNLGPFIGELPRA